MERGRPKNEIPRSESLHLRLTKFELEKISRIAKQKNISRTEAILKGIDLLIAHKPKKFANVKEIQKKRREEWLKKGLKIYDDDNDDD
mgnify:CR=1 FL=1